MCTDADLSRKSRYDFLNKYADSGATIYPAHFTGAAIGEIRSDDNGWRFDFADI